MVLWLVARNLPVAPPCKADLALYLTSVTCTRRTKSAAPEAARAYQFVAWLNRYERLSDDPCFRVTIEDPERAFSGPIKKPTPAEAWMTVAIIRGLADDPLWKQVIAWATAVDELRAPEVPRGLRQHRFRPAPCRRHGQAR